MTAGTGAMAAAPAPAPMGMRVAAFAALAVTPTLSVDNANKNAREAKYAVRGEIVAKATEYANQLKAGKAGLPFDRVVFCNIGNPQQLGQKPISFFRQVIALCDFPDILDNPKVTELYPQDAIDRARRYLDAIPGGVGAYSASNGVDLLRQEVADAITRRDGGHACNPADLYLTDGASPTVHYLMKILLRSPSDGVLTPLPQYPLYSAAIELYNGTLVPYYLSEEKGWGMDVAHMKEQLDAARANGTCVRSVVVINPGNPTGQVLDVEDQRRVVEFCKRENLLLVADEVYQENVYSEKKKFTSFKKVVRDMGPEYDGFPLISMHSVSKGFYGECGRRAGYMEIVGMSQEIKDLFLKLASVSLCSNVAGQICMALVMNPPKEGEASFELYNAEKTEILASLKRRAVKLTAALDALDGVECKPAEGALYAFPRLYLPEKFVAEAKGIGREPDMHYCMLMLESTGVVTVPGSGFGQAEGTHHFRTTFLPSESDIDTVIAGITDFHTKLLAKYQ